MLVLPPGKQINKMPLGNDSLVVTLLFYGLVVTPQKDVYTVSGFFTWCGPVGPRSKTREMVLS